jgi:hypothetical protein
VAIIQDPQEVQDHLASMGLTASVLTRAVLAGAGGYNATTAFHPLSAPGTYLYQEATAGLRRGINGRGDWTFDEDDRQPQTYSLERGVAIVVQTGDENTGIDTGREPRPRNPKGVATLKKVARNSNQLALFSVGPASLPGADAGEMLTWILLIAVVEDTVRAELSLPREWKDGRPCGWLIRLPLEEQPLGGVPSEKVDKIATLRTPDISVAWKQ